jgi:hypothetical protein
MSSEVETSLDALACEKKSGDSSASLGMTEDGDAGGGLKEILLPVVCSISKLQS